MIFVANIFDIQMTSTLVSLECLQRKSDRPRIKVCRKTKRVFKPGNARDLPDLQQAGLLKNQISNVYLILTTNLNQWFASSAVVGGVRSKML